MSTESKLRALLSLNSFEYDHLLETFSSLATQKLSTVTLSGQFRLFKSFDEPVNSSLPESKAKLDFILMYLIGSPKRGEYEPILL